MKLYLPIALALACAVLVVTLFMTKQSDNAQHQKDADAMADFSNQLDSAQIQIASYKGATITLSNRLDECRSATLTVSNQLVIADTAVIAGAMEQITNLNQQIAAVQSENQILDQRVKDLTGQVIGLTNQIAVAESSLRQARKECALLEYSLRRDVAERVVVERKFNNLSELQAQTKKIKDHPTAEISAESIYASLNVEVTSNGFHILSPN